MSSFILSTLVPGAGAIISLAMYASPVSAVLKAQAKASLGDLNAVPFAITVANCITWLVYGKNHQPCVTSFRDLPLIHALL
jgi:hypothetical protein